MSYIIIGGGISGLYCAYSLHKKLGIKDIILLEKSDRFGGRLYTKYLPDGTNLELGGSRISDGHINIINLINELGLSDKIGKGSSGRSLIEFKTLKINQESQESSQESSQKSSQESSQELLKLNDSLVRYQIDKITPIEKTDFYQIVDNLKNNLSNQEFYQIAINYTLHGLIEKYYGVDKSNYMRFQFGYDNDFLEQNAVDGLLMFSKMFRPSIKFHGITGGYSQVIFKLVEYLKENQVKIYLNIECLDIIKNNNQYLCITSQSPQNDNQQTKFLVDNIIFAIPKMDLLKIKYLHRIKNKLNSVVHKPLMRIYAFFPLTNDHVWFENINTTLTTNTILRQIIPIDKQKGILMIYCDSLNAMTWYYLENKNLLENELTFNLRKFFDDQSIPKPTKIYTFYHDSATHVWRPTIDSYKMSPKIMKPIEEENIFIVGEAYSLIQQWAEGAVETVNRLTNMLKNK